MQQERLGLLGTRLFESSIHDSSVHSRLRGHDPITVGRKSQRRYREGTIPVGAYIWSPNTALQHPPRCLVNTAQLDLHTRIPQVLSFFRCQSRGKHFAELCWTDPKAHTLLHSFAGNPPEPLVWVFLDYFWPGHSLCGKNKTKQAFPCQKTPRSPHTRNLY